MNRVATDTDTAVNVLALVKGGERYVFLYNAAGTTRRC